MISGSGYAYDPSVDDHNISDFTEIDYSKLVSKADLTYDKPVSLGQAGMPLGNGRMGSMIWTSSTSLKMQIK